MSTNKVSATLAINNLTKQRIANGLETFKLGFGQSPFPVPEILVEALRKNAPIKDYLSTQGLPELRKAVAGYYSSRFNLDVSMDQVIIGPGSKELLFLSQLVCKRELLLQAPSWVTYAPQAALLNLPVNWIQTKAENSFMMTPNELRGFLEKHRDKKFVFVLNQPNNPTGGVYSDSDLQEIADIAKEFDLLILSDEIYGEFTFFKDHKSIYHYYPEGTFVFNGLSKWCGAGGWRLAFMIVPKNLDDVKGKLLQAGSETYSCTAAPMQYAALAAFHGDPSIDHYTRSCNRILKRIGKYLQTNLDENKVQMSEPKGGFYSFLQFKNQNDKSGQELCLRLIDETGVAIIPGSAFGRPSEELSARMAYVDFDGTLINDKDFMENVETVEFNKYFPKIVEAVNRLNRF